MNGQITTQHVVVNKDWRYSNACLHNVHQCVAHPYPMLIKVGDFAIAVKVLKEEVFLLEKPIHLNGCLFLFLRTPASFKLYYHFSLSMKYLSS